MSGETQRLRFGIAAKIWSALLIMIVGFVISIGLGHWHARQVRTRLEAVNAKLRPAAEHTDAASLAFKAAVRRFQDAVVFGEEEMLSTGRRRIQEAMGHLRGARTAIGDDDQHTWEVERLEKRVAAYGQGAADVYTVLCRDPEDEAAVAAAGPLAREMELLQEDLNALKQRDVDVIDDELRAVGKLTGSRQRLNMVLLTAVAVTATLMAWLLIRKLVTKPLTQVAARVTSIADGDLEQRLAFDQRDEMGELAAAFNKMTAALRTSLDDLQSEVNERKQAENEVRALNRDLERRVIERTEELERSHSELMEVARAAGMAEVATDVLHNVGNVMNSVSVTVSLTGESLKNSAIPQLQRVTALLHDHRDDLGQFLTRTPKGQKVPGLLSKLGSHLGREHEHMLKNVRTLHEQIEHVSEIISVQQSAGRTVCVREPTDLSRALEDAVRINEASFQRHDITVVRQFDDVADAMIDRHLLLQILTNLISNARYALIKSDQARPTVTLQLRQQGENVVITVRDNGVGIAAHDLDRIFTHGFTTRNEGHGFGLHAAANAAGQLGGSLHAASDGPGEGAVFTLEFPLTGTLPPSTGRTQTREDAHATGE